MKNEFEIFVSAYENGKRENPTSVIRGSKSNQLCIIVHIVLGMIEGDCLSFRIFVYLFIPSVRKDYCIQYSLLTPTDLLGTFCKMFLLYPSLYDLLQ